MSKISEKNVEKLLGINNAIMTGRKGTALGVDDDGTKYAEFTSYYRGKEYTYRVYEDGYIYRKPYTSGIKNNYKFTQVIATTCKNGIYPVIMLDGIYVKLYNLVHACFDLDFSEWFCKNAKKVVNHTVVSRWIDNSLRPHVSVWGSLQHTEVVTLSENVRHGKFVNSLGLVDIYVSAFDVDDLTAEFVLYARENGVSSIYDIPYDTKCDIIVDYYDKLSKSGKPVPNKVDFRK